MCPYLFEVKVEIVTEQDADGERRLQATTTSNDEGAKLLDKFDTNGDGVLDASEVLVLLAEEEATEEISDGNEVA